MLNEWFIGDCWSKMNKRSAVGVDQVSARDYERDLHAHVRDLVERLKADRYRAPYVRRHYIPKGPGTFRPLGIPTTEDKLLQKAVARILGAIYEQDFLPCSFGYREHTGAKAAVKSLSEELATGTYKAIVEADIQGFFDHLQGDVLVEMLRKRLDDRRFLRLIQKWLKAGVLDPAGMVVHPLTGTPQGGIVSPVLANVYLHYALDEWFETVVKPHCRGKAKLWRYADDFVCAFEDPADAQRFYRVLGQRLGKFGLSLAMDKTKVIDFDAEKSTARFDFLGFEFGWYRTRRGYPRLGRRTSRSKLRKSIASFTQWIQTRRSQKLRQTMQTVNAKLRGYCNYYGMEGNWKSLNQYFWAVNQRLKKWLNRRSQRRSFTEEELEALMKRYGFPTPFVRDNAPDPYGQALL
jgi:RNA-directed DNA polymerase